MRSGHYGRVRQISYVLPVAPGQVTGLAAGTPTSTSVPLSWPAVAVGTPPISYRIEYKRATDSAWTLDTVQSGSSRAVPGLQPSTSYQFRVRAENSAGAGAFSAVLSVSTAAQQITLSVSAAPSTYTITPPFASVIPGADPVSGAAGEITGFSKTSEDNVTFVIFLRIRGTYTPQSLPFNAMQLGSKTFLRTSAGTTVQDGITSVRWAINGDPAPPGSHQMVFT